ncbi:hypothetical protein WN51_10769 [Melipona quadrifasciata]|uniref:Uncharacterized protein n=1 Tax=Melipona quadrifasciata TaxID=166423 RepID=A0A0M9A6H0_9HYME|nr:hypothetical protein WN51_10769 [Melipona quadrifasciata]
MASENEDAPVKRARQHTYRQAIISVQFRKYCKELCSAWYPIAVNIMTALPLRTWSFINYQVWEIIATMFYPVFVSEQPIVTVANLDSTRKRIVLGDQIGTRDYLWVPLIRSTIVESFETVQDDRPGFGLISQIIVKPKAMYIFRDICRRRISENMTGESRSETVVSTALPHVNKQHFVDQYLVFFLQIYQEVDEFCILRGKVSPEPRKSGKLDRVLNAHVHVYVYMYMCMYLRHADSRNMHAKDRWNTNGKYEMKDRKNCDRDEIEMLACKQRKLEQSGGETWFRAWFMPNDMTVLEKVGIRGTLDLETTQRRKEITPAVFYIIPKLALLVPMRLHITQDGYELKSSESNNDRDVTDSDVPILVVFNYRLLYKLCIKMSVCEIRTQMRRVQRNSRRRNRNTNEFA